MQYVYDKGDVCVCAQQPPASWRCEIVIAGGERREAEETRRREATAEKAKSEAAEAKKTAPGQTDQAAPAAEPAKQTVAVEEAAAAEEKEKKTPPEVEPLPPKKEFQYGDDLTLD